MILNACNIKILLQKQYWENLKIIVVENTWKWGTAREKEQTKKYKFFPDGFQNMNGLPLWNRRFKQGGCGQEDRLYPRRADLPRFRVANQAVALLDFPPGRGCRRAARRPLSGSAFDGRDRGRRCRWQGAEFCLCPCDFSNPSNLRCHETTKLRLSRCLALPQVLRCLILPEGLRRQSVRRCAGPERGTPRSLFREVWWWVSLIAEGRNDRLA